MKCTWFIPDPNLYKSNWLKENFEEGIASEMKARSSLELSLCTQSSKSHFLHYLLRFLAEHQLNEEAFNEVKHPKHPTNMRHVWVKTIILYGGKISFHEHCLVKRLLGIGSKSQVKPPCSLFWVSANRRNSLISIIGQTSSQEVAKQKVAVNSILQCGLSRHFISYLHLSFEFWK